jgi:hypothetical protein
MTMPTLLDIAKANGSDAVVGLIDEASRAHPEITLGFARPIKGLNYKTLVRTAVPTGGGFRNANDGNDAVKGTYENRLVECYIYNPRWVCDKAVADRYEDGAPAYIAMEAGAIMEGSLQDLCRQFYYGTHATLGNAKGYPGLIQAYDATNMVVDAGGTTDDTASSAWLVRFGPKDVSWVWGGNGQLQMADPREGDQLGANGKPYTAYIQELLAYPGLQVGSLFSACRIKKLTADAGKGMTQHLISAALAKFPVGYAPTHLFLNRRSIEQLRSSIINDSLTASWVPTPENLQNLQLVVTDSIANTEKLAL